MKHAVFAFRKAYGKFQYRVSMVAGLFTFAMMWLIDVNALSRKIFNAPVPGGVEITQSLLCFVIMLPFGYVLSRGEHVNTVFLTSRFPHAVNRALHVFWMTVGCLVFAAVTWGTFQFALRSYAMSEQVWGATIRFPVWPAKMAVSLGAFLLAVQFALEALVGLVADRDGGLGAPVAEHEEGHLHV